MKRGQPAELLSPLIATTILIGSYFKQGTSEHLFSEVVRSLQSKLFPRFHCETSAPGFGLISHCPDLFGNISKLLKLYLYFARL